MVSFHRRVAQYRKNYVTTSLVIIGYFWNSSLHKQRYLAAKHKRILEVFVIQNPWGVLAYMAYSEMCPWTGYGFCPLSPKQGI